MPVVWPRPQRKATHYTRCYKADVDHEAQTVGGMTLENKAFLRARRGRAADQPTGKITFKIYNAERYRYLLDAVTHGYL